MMPVKKSLASAMARNDAGARMKKLTACAAFFVVLALVIALFRERQARTNLDEALRSVQLRMQELAEQVAALQKEQERAMVVPRAGAEKAEATTELARLRAEVAQLRETLAQLERSNAAITNEIA